MFRGAVRPPFIEARANVLKLGYPTEFRGAVRPPFIEASLRKPQLKKGRKFRGAVRPPFIEAVIPPLTEICLSSVSGGSPPPLH